MALRISISCPMCWYSSAQVIHAICDWRDCIYYVCRLHIYSIDCETQSIPCRSFCCSSLFVKSTMPFHYLFLMELFVTKPDCDLLYSCESSIYPIFWQLTLIRLLQSVYANVSTLNHFFGVQIDTLCQHIQIRQISKASEPWVKPFFRLRINLG